MAYSVSIRVPELEVLNSDVEFDIRQDDEKLGELHISKGNAEWWPSGNSVNSYQLDWPKLAYLFELKGIPVTRRK